MAKQKIKDIDEAIAKLQALKAAGTAVTVQIEEDRPPKPR